MNSAIISKDQKYRYRLVRDVWPQHESFFGVGEGACCFIMLNPSTADEVNDDPTIRRCVAFARSFECERLEVVNLFAYRATDPTELTLSQLPKVALVGPDNNRHIVQACNDSRIIVCAWGNYGGLFGRASEVLQLIRAQGRIQPMALKINKLSGQPAHPLYLKGNSQLLPIE